MGRFTLLLSLLAAFSAPEATSGQSSAAQSAAAQSPGTSAGETFSSKFGNEWPALQQCLEFSEESGEWGSGAVTYRFNPGHTENGNAEGGENREANGSRRDGGTFVATYDRDYTNRLGRRKTRTVSFHGTWQLTRRTFRPAERVKLQMPAGDRQRAYFLTLVFTENRVDPPFDDEARIPPIFPAPAGGELQAQAVLLLDEENPYPRPGRSSAGVSDPRYLHWIVIEDELPFFPKDTALQEKAWTLGHR